MKIKIMIKIKKGLKFDTLMTCLAKLKLAKAVFYKIPDVEFNDVRKHTSCPIFLQR